MRFDKLTAKFQQALQTGQSLALAQDCGYLEAGFVLKALLDDADSGMSALLVKAGGNVAQSNSLMHCPKCRGRAVKFCPAASCKTP